MTDEFKAIKKIESDDRFLIQSETISVPFNHPVRVTLWNGHCIELTFQEGEKTKLHYESLPDQGLVKFSLIFSERVQLFSTPIGTEDFIRLYEDPTVLLTFSFSISMAQFALVTLSFWGLISDRELLLTTDLAGVAS